jgi:hypothetical protein
LAQSGRGQDLEDGSETHDGCDEEVGSNLEIVLAGLLCEKEL